MKQVYSFRTGLEAHDARLFLESQGIEAKVFGDNNAFETGFSFTPASAPGLFVNEEDFDRAGELLEQFFDQTEQPPQGKWICPHCGESVEEQFDLCWKCESPRGNTPIIPAVERQELEAEEEESNTEAEVVTEPQVSVIRPARSEWSLGAEVVFVLAINWVVGWLISTRVLLPAEHSFTVTSMWEIAYEIFVFGVVLAVISRSGEPWSTFGLGKFRPLIDMFIGLAVFCAMLYIYGVGMDILRALLDSICDPNKVRELFEHTTRSFRPVGGREVALGIVTMICVAVSEELVMRGYLIPRLKQLLRWTWCSVLVSAVIFAAFHWFQGVRGVWGSFMIGVVFGVVFVYARRIWPLAITHALLNIVVMLRPD